VSETNAPSQSSPVKPGKGEILLNFQGAPLGDVLNYLSEAAGFVIVQEAAVTGTLNVISRQPVTAEEAVDLLNAVLVEKGYVALRNGRILKIVSRKDAQKRDLPVETGSDPNQIPRKDQMVTQILPLRYGEAAKLVENLKPLLADNSTISANEGSNSILLTDTQSNVHRIAEIIRAIDTSVASISTIHVYPLQFANAKELAAVITQLFSPNTASGSGQGASGRRGFGGFSGFGGFGGGGGSSAGTPSGAAQSEARQAASRIVAVADDQSNSLIISAPEDLLPTISDVVKKIDTSITDVTESRIYRLTHADAVETAQLISALFDEDASSKGRNSANDRGSGNRLPFMIPGMPTAGGQNANQSQRTLLQSRVVAVGDPRTNSLLVSAARDTMMQIAEMVGRLDSTDSKKQRVYIHSLEHADADSVAEVLRGMLGNSSGTGAAGGLGTSRLNQRSATGAAINPADAASTARSSR
jgi:general secretion pathway protein D